jgi:hypothetical protein
LAAATVSRWVTSASVEFACRPSSAHHLVEAERAHLLLDDVGDLLLVQAHAFHADQFAGELRRVALQSLQPAL